MGDAVQTLIFGRRGQSFTVIRIKLFFSDCFCDQWNRFPGWEKIPNFALKWHPNTYIPTYIRICVRVGISSTYLQRCTKASLNTPGDTGRAVFSVRPQELRKSPASTLAVISFTTSSAAYLHRVEFSLQIVPGAIWLCSWRFHYCTSTGWGFLALAQRWHYLWLVITVCCWLIETVCVQRRPEVVDAAHARVHRGNALLHACTIIFTGHDARMNKLHRGRSVYGGLLHLHGNCEKRNGAASDSLHRRWRSIAATLLLRKFATIPPDGFHRYTNGFRQWSIGFFRIFSEKTKYSGKN